MFVTSIYRLPMKETRGRKSLPADKRKPPQSTVKINDAILPLVKELKGNLRNKTLTPAIIQSLFDVMNGGESNNDIDLNGQIEKLKNLVNVQNQKIYELNDKPLTKKNLELVLKYDAEHLKAVKLESLADRLSSDKVAMRAEIEALKAKEHSCQMITKSGSRCKSNGLYKAVYQGIELMVCGQHNAIINSN